jgi:ABC-type uncharacterized transport system permease subunit
MRINGDSKPRKVKINLVNSRVERIPLNMNAATKILIAISCLFLKIRKKINKLVVEINTIIKMFSVAKKLFPESNIGVELVPYVCTNNVK